MPAAITREIMGYLGYDMSVCTRSWRGARVTAPGNCGDTRTSRAQQLAGRPSMA